MNGTIRHRTCPAHETSDTDDSRTSVSHSTSSSPSVSSRLQHFMEGSPFALDNGSTSSLHATTSATKMIEWERRYYQKELPPFVEERGYPVRTNLPQSVLLIGESGEYTGDSTLQRDHLLKCVAYLADAKKKRPFQPPPPVAEQAIARPLYTETSSHLDAVTRLGEPTPREFLLRSKLDALSELGRRRELGLDEIESKIKTCDQLLEIEEGKPDIHAATSG
ncbi:MAG: hypothetical protein LQ346_000972 [Caloplaca aetnensis]|nr:MAG: hypothetical protein LQ346_000972 [Caloplaca aetnensis]